MIELIRKNGLKHQWIYRSLPYSCPDLKITHYLVPYILLIMEADYSRKFDLVLLSKKALQVLIKYVYSQEHWNRSLSHFPDKTVSSWALTFAIASIYVHLSGWCATSKTISQSGTRRTCNLRVFLSEHHTPLRRILPGVILVQCQVMDGL
jgi:hypothetical protein